MSYINPLRITDYYDYVVRRNDISIDAYKNLPPAISCADMNKNGVDNICVTFELTSLARRLQESVNDFPYENHSIVYIAK